MPQDGDAMTESINRRLLGLGFLRDPFAFPDAAKIDPDTLEETFVAHPGFNEQVMDLSLVAVLLAQSGAGKTAGRRRVETWLNDQQRQILGVRPVGRLDPRVPLVVSYYNFQHIVGQLPNIDLAQHTSALLAAFAAAVAAFVKEHLVHVAVAPVQERQWWLTFLRAYLDGEDIDYWMRSSSLASDWWQTKGRPAPFLPNSTLDSILTGLETHLVAIGINPVYVLVDGMDGYVQTQSQHNLEALARPLLNTLSLFEPSYLMWKFFLPSALEPLVRQSAGFKKGRLYPVPIQWDEPSLTEFLGLRLNWASDGRVPDIGKLCEQSLLNAVNVERDLIRMALRYRRLGPPRALLELGRQLFARPATSQDGMLLSLDDWYELKKQVGLELFPNLFLVYTPEDRLFVERLADDLQTQNPDVWPVRWEMQTNDTIRMKLQQHIGTGDYLVFILSPETVDSRWAQELTDTLIRKLDEDGVYIILIHLRDCAIPQVLSDYICIDFRIEQRTINRADSTNPSLETMSRADLRQWITQHFDENELRTLCFDLDVEYDNLLGSNKEGKVRELIAYCARKNRMAELTAQIRQLQTPKPAPETFSWAGPVVQQQYTMSFEQLLKAIKSAKIRTPRSDSGIDSAGE